jgi:hypothetical protein
MPEEIKIWEFTNGKQLREIEKGRFMDKYKERFLEDLVEKDISLISDDLLIIGRQVPTYTPKECIDLLCLDPDGNTVLIELKRDKTPREVTAQALYYASWINNELSYEQINEIAENTGISLTEGFSKKFEDDLPETLNESHKIIIVASDMDDETEKIIKYLSDYGVNINFVKFQYFQDASDKREFIGRIFFIEPEELDEKIKSKKRSVEWAEEYVKNFVTILKEKGFKDIEYYMIPSKTDWRVKRTQPKGKRDVWLKILPRSRKRCLRVVEVDSDEKNDIPFDEIERKTINEEIIKKLGESF